MGEERLAALTLMNVHYEETLKLNATVVVKKFIKTNPRKMFCKQILF